MPTTVKKEVRFEGDYQDTLPRSRSYSGRSNNGRRKKGKSKKYTSDNRLNDSHHHSKHKGHHRSSQNQPQPSTSNQARLRSDLSEIQPDDPDYDDSESSSMCSTCSSSSSDSEDFAYQLPQRRVYGGVRVSYVPNDAVACARKQQQRRQGTLMDQSGSSDQNNKNCIIS